MRHGIAQSEYVRRGQEMEETSVEVQASCGHPVEVRFYEGVSETARRNGLAEVVSEWCSFCLADVQAGIDGDYVALQLAAITHVEQEDTDG